MGREKGEKLATWYQCVCVWGGVEAKEWGAVEGRVENGGRHLCNSQLPTLRSALFTPLWVEGVRVKAQKKYSEEPEPSWLLVALVLGKVMLAVFVHKMSRPWLTGLRLLQRPLCAA